MPHFKNRKEAAILLAEKLEWLKDVYMESSLTVLDIPGGGVVIGDTLTSIIGGEFDILMSEKIVAPYNFNVTGKS